ncbi:MAG: NAD(P)H-binding protein [Bacteroidota bacterium]
MTITIFGASGTVGKELILHCQAKGYKVRAFGRNVEDLIDEDLRDDNFKAIKGSVFDAGDVLKAVTGTDAVLTALGGNVDGTDVTRSLGMKNIIAQMKKAGVKRIVGLGNRGVLNADENTFLIDTPDYPSEYLAVGHEHLKAYEYLAASDLDWTFVCPPDILPKAADGHLVTREDYPTDGNSINAGNLALFMVQEITNNQFLHHRVGISNS